MDPWGNVVAGLKGEEDIGQVVTAKIDLAKTEEIRRGMPLLRRTDVYPEV